jgi:hypothetical protein
MGYPNIQPGTSPLVRYEMEFLPASEIMQIPGNIKALFALYAYDSELRNFNVMYIGYANNEGGNTIRSLLKEQERLNGRMWSHFSVYELWDYIQKDDQRAVDMLFKQIYRRDALYRREMTRSSLEKCQNNLFVPKQLFTSFIERISRTSTQIVDNGERNRSSDVKIRPV